MKHLKLYTAIVYGLIWVVGAGFYFSGADYHSLTGNIIAAVCMLFPLIATFVCQAIAREPLFRNIGIHWKVNWWWVVGWLLMPVVVLLTIGFDWCINGDAFTTDSLAFNTLRKAMNIPVWAIVAITVVSGLFAGITINALFAFGEEVGWRGYLLRQFHGQPFISTAVFIGIIWGLWHAPLILLGHNYPQHPVAGVFFMMAMCIPLTIIIQYIRLKSGSVIVAAIMHGTYNAVAGTTLFFLNEPNDLLDGCTGIAGITVLVVVAFALFLYDRYGSKERLFTRPLDLEMLK